MEVRYIDNNAALAAYCSAAERASQLAIDTEFISGKTYRPQLTLIQICDGNDIVLIDALRITDTEPLSRLFGVLDSPCIMHAPDQDVGILRHYCGKMPKTVYDTQLAASFLGVALQAGYRKLVESFLGIQINKTMRHSDWGKRPLSSAQLEYAANDVRYLLPLWATLKQHLRDRNRFEWFVEDSEQRQRLFSEDEKPSSNTAYCAMSDWRRKQAERLDIPPNRLLSAQNLKKLLRLRNPNRENVKDIIKTGHGHVSADRVLQALSDAREVGRGAVYSPFVNPQTLERAQKVLDNIALRLRITPALIISRKKLSALFRNPEKYDCGWRAPLLREVITVAREPDNSGEITDQLIRFLDQINPGCWLTVANRPEEIPGEILQGRVPPEITTVADYGGVPSNYGAQRFDAGVIWRALSVPPTDDEMHLLARLRDMDCKCLFVCAPAGCKQYLIELGFHRLASTCGEYTLFIYDIAKYKRTPDWLNSRHWANPEHWNKARW